MPIFIEQAYDVSLFLVLACVFFATLFVGIGKAGFGGGVGLISPPLYAQVMPMRVLVPMMLPLLIICDATSMWVWWKRWDLKNLWLLLPGTVAGVIAGSKALSAFPERYLTVGLGLIALAFVAMQVLRQRGTLTGAHFRPVFWQGTLCGAAAGFCSTLAHAAGPIITLFLLPQGLGKERFVATTVIYFTCLNLIKVPFYIGQGILTWEVTLSALWLAPVVVLGALLGKWLNGRVSERAFTNIVYVIIVLTAVKLLMG